MDHRPWRPMSDDMDALLRPCRDASSQEALALALQQLCRDIPQLALEQDCVTVASFLVKDIVASTSDAVTKAVDECLEACGLRVTLSSVCVPNLLEAAVASTTTASSPWSLQTVLRTIRRLVTTLPNNNKDSSLYQLIHDYDDPSTGTSVNDLVTLVLLLPVQIAAACHTQQLQLPAWAVKSRFCPRLVQCATTAAVCHSQDAVVTSYFVSLIAKMVLHGGHNDVALGLHHSYSHLGKEQEDVFSQKVFQAMKSIASAPRECATLMKAILQQLISTIPQEKSLDWEEMCRTRVVPYLLVTCQPILQTFRPVQEEWIRLVILSSSASLASLLSWQHIVPYSLVQVLATCQPTNEEEESDSDSDDDESNHIVDLDSTSGILLWRATNQIASTWCQTVFVQHTDLSSQHVASQFVLEALSRLPLGGDNKVDFVSSRLVSNLLSGVTVRLESSISEIRLDGMRVAEELAKHLGQSLKFEELDAERAQQEAKQNQNPMEPSATTSKEHKKRPRGKSTKAKPYRAKRRTVDPDEEYVSDDDDDDDDSTGSDEDGSHDAESMEVDHDEDDDSVWDDEDDILIPYDLEDDEEDLRETPRPLYLKDCLALLRVSDEDTAYSQQEAALQEVAKLVRSHPPDLGDYAVPIAHQLLHLENKFYLEGFESMVQDGLVACAVEEPWPVGKCLIGEMFGGVALLTRLEVLHTLEEAAYELSGAKALTENRQARRLRNAEFDAVPRVAGKRRLVNDQPPTESSSSDMTAHVGRTMNSMETRTRRWGRGRWQNTQLTVSNRFGPVAPMQFYCLLDGFMKCKDESSIWGGANGTRLLASFLVTLAVFVECSGSHSGTSVLAKDLFDLAWSFRTVEAPEVRQAVLISIANSVSFLDDSVLVQVLYGDGVDSLPDFLRRTALEDDDKSCRELARGLSKNVSQAINAIQGGSGSSSTIEMTPALTRR